MTDKKTPSVDIDAKKKSPFLLFLLGLGLLGLLGYALYESEKIEQANDVRAAAALKMKPKPAVLPVPAADKAPQIVDVTRDVQTAEAGSVFPERVVDSVPNDASRSAVQQRNINVQEVVAPPHLAGEIKPKIENKIAVENAQPQREVDVAATAEILQATLALAKVQAERQTVLAQLHTLMGLLQNPTQTVEEQQAWAELALAASRNINAQELTQALEAYVAVDMPTGDVGAAVGASEAASVTVVQRLLTPFKGLVTVTRVEDASGPAVRGDLAPVLGAYKALLREDLMKEGR